MPSEAGIQRSSRTLAPCPRIVVLVIWKNTRSRGKAARGRKGRQGRETTLVDATDLYVLRTSEARAVILPTSHRRSTQRSKSLSQLRVRSARQVPSARLADRQLRTRNYNAALVHIFESVHELPIVKSPRQAYPPRKPHSRRTSGNGRADGVGSRRRAVIHADVHFPPEIILSRLLA